MNQIDITLAHEILAKNIADIKTINDWATLMNWKSIRMFSITIKQFYSMPPYEMIIFYKIKMAVNLIENHPHLSCLEIAKTIGKKNERELNKFLKYHTGKSPKDYRK